MFAALCVIAEARAAVEVKSVLVIYPYEPEPTLFNDFDQTLSSTLASNPKIAVRSYAEYLDLMRFPDEAHERQLAEYLRVKYADRKLDLIISMGIALDFLLKHGEQVFPGTPIVFTSLANQRLKNYTLRPNMTGLAMKVDYRGTLDMILALQPDTRRVVLVSGTSAGDQFWISEAQKVFQDYQDKLTFSVSTELSMSNLLDQMRNLPAHTVVFYDQMLRDATGHFLLSSESLVLICRSSSVPVYSIWKSYVGLGIVGGYVWDYAAEGAAVGNLGLRILAGDRPQDIPVRTLDTNHFVADQMQLRRWGISGRMLPTGSIVENKEPFYQAIWFWVLCAVGSAALIWAGYQWRIRLVTARLDLRFKERLAERTRIARELHDTLLQNVVGLCLQIGGLSKVVTGESAKDRLQAIRRQGEECLREARQAVWNIRSLESESLDLATELRESGERLSAGKVARFNFIVEGEPRRIPLDLREHLLRIGREGISNAVRHAQAEQIEVRLTFETEAIRVRISDNGCGFSLDDASRLPGHFGLTTMRERAEQIRASIVISSEVRRGTCIEVTVPGAI